MHPVVIRCRAAKTTSFLTTLWMATVNRLPGTKMQSSLCCLIATFWSEWKGKQKINNALGGKLVTMWPFLSPDTNPDPAPLRHLEHVERPACGSHQYSGVQAYGLPHGWWRTSPRRRSRWRGSPRPTTAAAGPPPRPATAPESGRSSRPPRTRGVWASGAGRRRSPELNGPISRGGNGPWP